MLLKLEFCIQGSNFLDFHMSGSITCPYMPYKETGEGQGKEAYYRVWDMPWEDRVNT
jgi:hypothetical protein